MYRGIRFEDWDLVPPSLMNMTSSAHKDNRTYMCRDHKFLVIIDKKFIYCFTLDQKPSVQIYKKDPLMSGANLKEFPYNPAIVERRFITSYT